VGGAVPLGLAAACSLINDFADLPAPASDDGTTVTQTGAGSGGGAGAVGGGDVPATGGGGGAAPGCGDGVLAEGEACDDGNLVDGDGCSSKCAYDAADTCPPTSIIPVGDAPVVLTGNTVGATADAATVCSAIVPTLAPDVVYAVEPVASGRIVVELEAATFAEALYVRDACDGAVLACTGEPASLSMSVVAGKTYYVFVDGQAKTDTGSFSLSVELAICGNMDVELGEECDDGNTTPGDGCSESCVVECPNTPGYGKEPTTHHCYAFFKLNKTWSAALAACKMLGAGWDLAAVTSPGELDFVDKLVSSDDTWIGGHDQNTENSFEWTTGEPWSYAPWAGGQPPSGGEDATDCVILDYNSDKDLEGFAEAACGQGRNHLCERQPAGT
jgi:cysteine-rich repeat protein